jgi:hypothetical protein
LSSRIMYRNDTGNAYYWWMRSPRLGYASFVYYGSVDGSLNSYTADYTLGVPAACTIV